MFLNAADAMVETVQLVNGTRQAFSSFYTYHPLPLHKSGIRLRGTLLIPRGYARGSSCHAVSRLRALCLRRHMTELII